MGLAVSYGHIIRLNPLSLPLVDPVTSSIAVNDNYPTYFSITSTSKHKEAAMEVIKFLTSDENQMELSKLGNMPVVNEETRRYPGGFSLLY